MNPKEKMGLYAVSKVKASNVEICSKYNDEIRLNFKSSEGVSSSLWYVSIIGFVIITFTIFVAYDYFFVRKHAKFVSSNI